MSRHANKLQYMWGVVTETGIILYWTLSPTKIGCRNALFQSFRGEKGLKEGTLSIRRIELRVATMEDER